MRLFSAKSFVASLAILDGFVIAQKATVNHEVSSPVEAQIKGHWDFNERPSSNSISNHIFNTVQSLLQHWPNTRYRNGHTIIPATVPVGTLLYHGTFKTEIPKVPEWVATDPEHSYLFCRSMPDASGCWHLTLVATRPLKVLYFDGSSAAKMYGGPMDSQDLTIWGEVIPEKTMKERERIIEICEWGKQYGLDGFVRMEMDFEIMLCDFSVGVETVSFLNLASAEGVPDLPPPKDVLDPAPPEDQPRKPPGIPPPMLLASSFRVMESGSWHNHFPGDIRIQLDYSRLISFYDTDSFPSLQVARLGQTRLDHRLDKISKKDSAVLAGRLREYLSESYNVKASGVNWQGLIKTITNRYDERLEVLHYILNSTVDPSDLEYEATLKKAHRHVRSMLAPYTLYSATLPTILNASTTGNHSWASSVFKLCATTHTSFIDASLSGQLTPSEHLILGAVKGVSREICRVIVGIWAEGMEYGLAALDVGINPANSAVPPAGLMEEWVLKIESLMSWLDWSYWNRCRPACSYEEMCFLPTWPFFRRRPGRAPGPPGISTQHPLVHFGSDTSYIDDEEWVDPKPRCKRRVEPFMSI